MKTEGFIQIVKLQINNLGPWMPFYIMRVLKDMYDYP